MRIPEIVSLLIFILVLIYACAQGGEQSAASRASEWQECLSFTPLSTNDGDTTSYKIERWSYKVVDCDEDLAINKSLHISWSEVEGIKSAILNNDFPTGANFRIVGDTLFYWGAGDIALDM